MASVTISTIPELFIGYAMAYCHDKQVATVFNTILDDDIVDSVASTEGTNFQSGKPFKRFFIKFKHTSANLEKLLVRLRDEKFVNISYDGKWFWKVIINEKKEVKDNKPRIMEKGEGRAVEEGEIVA